MTLCTFAEVNQKQNKVLNFVANEFQKLNILTFGKYEVVICTKRYLQR